MSILYCSRIVYKCNVGVYFNFLLKGKLIVYEVGHTSLAPIIESYI